jgi:ribonuclease P protein component
MFTAFSQTCYRRVAWSLHGQTDLQTEPPTPQEHPRIPRPHADPRRPEDPEPPPQARPQAPLRQHRFEVDAGKDSPVDGPPPPPPPPPPPKGERLPKRRRIHRGPDIRRILATGRRVRTGNLDLFVFAASSSSSRAGWIVPRHGRTIVLRNRLKRRLRELLRREVVPGLDHAGRPLDIVVRARPSAYLASLPELREELSNWLARQCSSGSSSA